MTTPNLIVKVGEHDKALTTLFKTMVLSRREIAGIKINSPDQNYHIRDFTPMLVNFITGDVEGYADFIIKNHTNGLIETLPHQDEIKFNRRNIVEYELHQD